MLKHWQLMRDLSRSLRKSSLEVKIKHKNMQNNALNNKTFQANLILINAQ
jgi:hypothetical protein